VFQATPCAHLVPFDGSFRLDPAATKPPEGAPTGKDAKRLLEGLKERIGDLQERLYAEDRHAVLLVFQAMDAAGKDGTIRAVTTGINPAGFQVFSFKQPSAEELDHDFLWRTARRLPERGRIGVFNRSYYEEVLVVRVHPEHLGGQRLPRDIPRKQLWTERYESIREHEAHLARSGIVVLKFFLHVSKEEQRQRFLSRLDEPEKQWKFSAGDVAERAHWTAYMDAYGDAMSATSRPWAPWYAIPADEKDYMRYEVARVVAASLESLDLKWPTSSAEEVKKFEALRRALEADTP
jgi:PPK2 family polyphosphate:nucleotide phosphotransferase